MPVACGTCSTETTSTSSRQSQRIRCMPRVTWRSSCPTEKQGRRIAVLTKQPHSRTMTSRELTRWRTAVRPRLLRRLAEQTAECDWSSRLIRLVLEELHVDEEFYALIGPLRRWPAIRYPQVLALAVASRHSWRPDDLFRIMRRLGARLPTRKLSKSASRRARRASSHRP